MQQLNSAARYGRTALLRGGRLSGSLNYDEYKGRSNGGSSAIAAARLDSSFLHGCPPPNAEGSKYFADGINRLTGVDTRITINPFYRLQRKRGNRNRRHPTFLAHV